MRQDIYLHSLHGGIKGYSSEATLELLEKILKSGAVLSTNLSGVPCNNNFSGADYISLCDYERKHMGKGWGKTYNGFYQYAVYDPSLMFPKDQVEVIHPIILKKMIIQYSNYVSFMRELGMEEDRYTDLEDEVQVRDRIDINKLCGMTFPTYEFLRIFKSVEHDTRVVFDELTKYKELLDKYGFVVPFYDVNSEMPMDTYDEVYETVYQLKKGKKKRF